jgi:uncharacterized CHY-type Zn-finger protein
MIRVAIASAMFWVAERFERPAHRLMVWVCDDCQQRVRDAEYRDSASIRCDACQERWERT